MTAGAPLPLGDEADDRGRRSDVVSSAFYPFAGPNREVPAELAAELDAVTERYKGQLTAWEREPTAGASHSGSPIPHPSESIERVEAVQAREADEADTAKAVATWQARAALAGFELVRLGDGSFLGSKPAWGMHTTLRDVAAIEAWLRRVGAPA